MKKTISILLSIAVILAAFLAVPSVSAEEAQDNESEEIVIDYDAGPYVGSEFRQIYWNGFAFNNYEGGEAPWTALAPILTNDGYVDDRGGSGQTLGLEGWVGFDQAITAFGAMINGDIEWDESFDKGSSAEIKSDDKGGRYAKFYSVNIDISKARNRYTAGVAVALADGTVVKLNSTDYPEANTFISFLGIEEQMPPELETGDVDKTPGPVLSFSDEDNFPYFFRWVNDIKSISYDDTLGCYVISMSNAYDPFFEFDLSALIRSGDLEEMSAEEFTVIQLGIRYDPAAGPRGQFFWQTSEHTEYKEEQSKFIQYEDTADYQVVNIDLRGVDIWEGNIANLRYDPLPACPGDCDVELYYIAFFRSMAGAVEFGEQWKEAVKAGKPFPTEEPKATAVPPTEAPTKAPTQIPATEIPPTEIPVTETPTGAPGESSGGPDKGLIIGLAGAGVTAIIAAVIVAIASKKKKK